MSSRPRITFGIIVLNGEPFTRYCLRALYPFAHQIIVVEGAAPAAQSIATSDGHSCDETLEVLRRFQFEEDPNNKLTILTAEDAGHPNGFWPGEKHEQSRAYAERATGDYLWQVDIDEFYQPQDMESVIQILSEDPSITAASFKQIQFWGGFDSFVEGWYLRRGGNVFHRLFQWKKGYQYATHRTPTVVYHHNRDQRTVHWLNDRTTARLGIRLYHYSLLLPKQVREKSEYYAHADWLDRKKACEWAEEVYFDLKRPFRVHNNYHYPGWLERFHGSHPPQIEALRRDIDEGIIQVELRATRDIQRLLGSAAYQLRIAALKILDYPDRLRERSMILRAITHPVASLRAIQRRLGHWTRTTRSGSTVPPSYDS
ncbi:MAG: glycosyltransferase family 2 protein [Planctomycetes bacterium]|nr:glycosyltransferase family 2 protein [Planctomycetota bacterium]